MGRVENGGCLTKIGLSVVVGVGGDGVHWRGRRWLVTTVATAEQIKKNARATRGRESGQTRTVSGNGEENIKGRHRRGHHRVLWPRSHTIRQRNHWEDSQRRASIRKMFLYRPQWTRENARSTLWHDGHAAGQGRVAHALPRGSPTGFILHLTGDSGTTTELAFLDARRLGRIRLRAEPLAEPPMSELGFDPLLSMPSSEQFSALVSKTTRPIKALLLDQSVFAGVGNWVADEVLYQSCIHPEQPCNTLSDNQRVTLLLKITTVCQKAVDVNADHHLFPDTWLFKHRWNKGKKGTQSLQLPSGKPATIEWLKVGGRTSAYVVELQRLPNTRNNPSTEEDQSDSKSSESSDLSDLSDLSDFAGALPPKRSAPSKPSKRVAKKARKRL